MYPWRPARWKPDWELRHSLRSLASHWQERSRVVLLSETRPAWLSVEVEHVRAPRYEDCLKAALGLGAERLVWMNDDIFMLQDTTSADLLPARYVGELSGGRLSASAWTTTENVWRHRLAAVARALAAEGRPTRNFSTHAPYLYEVDKLRITLERFPPEHKLPVETAYFNMHALPVAPGSLVLLLSGAACPPEDLHSYPFLSVSNGHLPTLHQPLRDCVARLFPQKCRYER